MVSMIYLYPYKTYSASARALRDSLVTSKDERVVLLKDTSKYKFKREDVVINWGNTKEPEWKFNNRFDLNSPEAVKIAANKLLTFERLQEKNVPIPRYTTDSETAKGWLTDGSTVLARTLLSSHSGRGITVVLPEQELPEALLYVLYKKKKAEYRVHVVNGEVIDTCIKRKRSEDERPETFNTFIRSYNNGWVFCRDNLPDCPLRNMICINAVKALGLSFGAIDIIYNASENQYYVLEVNTAPGLEGTTLTKYTEAFSKI